MKNRRRQGFTLVEIMIVLAILVLLIAMVGPRLLKQQDKADLQQTQNRYEKLQEICNKYHFGSVLITQCMYDSFHMNITCSFVNKYVHVHVNHNITSLKDYVCINVQFLYNVIFMYR